MWLKLQEHLLQVWLHQRFADRLEAVLPAPELDACIVAWQAQPDRRCPRLVPAPAQRGVEQGELGLRVAVQGLGMQPPQVQLQAVAHLVARRSEEHTSELQSLMRISYAVFCLKKTNNTTHTH